MTKHYTYGEPMSSPAPILPESPPPLTIAQAARLLGRSKDTVRHWIRAGDLPAERVNGRLRIPYAAVQELMDYCLVPEAADLIGVSRMGLYKRIRAGHIGVRILGRVRYVHRAEVQRLRFQAKKVPQ